MILELTPPPLMRVFHAPMVEVDCGTPDDMEAVACAAYLMWQVEYPGYRARLRIAGEPDAERELNRALFRRHRKE